MSSTSARTCLERAPWGSHSIDGLVKDPDLCAVLSFEERGQTPVRWTDERDEGTQSGSADRRRTSSHRLERSGTEHEALT